MTWLLLFGGIVLFAVALHLPLGIWLWRRLRALVEELDAALEKLDQAVPEEDGRHAATTAPDQAGSARRPEPARAGRRVARRAGPRGPARAYHQP